MAQPTEAQRQALERLRRTYIARMPARVDAIRRGVARAERGGYDCRALDAVFHLVHGLTGSSGIFGLGGLSAAARALEERISGLFVLSGLRPRPRGGLAALVEALERAASRAANGCSRAAAKNGAPRPAEASRGTRPRTARGGVHLSPSSSLAVVEACLRRAEAPADPLTPRERQVLHLIAEGKSTKEAARLLGISVKTAESHRTRMADKLGIHETAGLVRYAIRRVPSELQPGVKAGGDAS